MENLYEQTFSPFIVLPHPKHKKLSTRVKKKSPETTENHLYQLALKHVTSKHVAKDERERIAHDTIKCLRQMSDTRETFLGKNAKFRNGGESYLKVVCNILLGDNSYDEKLSPEQLCDLYEFVLQHHFWKQHIKTPSGLQRNLLKMWGSPEYNHWSVRQGKPQSHRNSTEKTETSGSLQKAREKGVIAADVAYDYDHEYISPLWGEDDD